MASTPKSQLVLLAAATVVLTLLGAWGVRLALAGPSAPPPGNNVPPPLHTGSGWQAKLGKLTLGSASDPGDNTLLVAGRATVNDSLTASSLATTGISSGGQFCLPGTTADGGGCIDKWSSIGGDNASTTLRYQTTCPGRQSCTIRIPNTYNVFACHTLWSYASPAVCNLWQQEDWNPLNGGSGIQDSSGKQIDRVAGWFNGNSITISKSCPNYSCSGNGSLCSLSVVCERYGDPNYPGRGWITQ